jgi:hypothetical protein
VQTAWHPWTSESASPGSSNHVVAGYAITYGVNNFTFVTVKGVRETRGQTHALCRVCARVRWSVCLLSPAFVRPRAGGTRGAALQARVCPHHDQQVPERHAVLIRVRLWCRCVLCGDSLTWVLDSPLPLNGQRGVEVRRGVIRRGGRPHPLSRADMVEGGGWSGREMNFHCAGGSSKSSRAVAVRPSRSLRLSLHVFARTRPRSDYTFAGFRSVQRPRFRPHRVSRRAAVDTRA